MRSRFALILAAALLASAARAQAPESDFARSVAVLDTIAAACPAFYAVDRKGLLGYRGLFAAAALRSLGQDAFARALQGQRAALQIEISAIGARAWCLTERAGLTGIGLQALFPAETLLG